MKQPMKSLPLFIAALLFSFLYITACGNNGRQETDEEGTYIDTLIENDPQDGNNMRNEQPTDPLTKKDSVNTDTL